MGERSKPSSSSSTPSSSSAAAAASSGSFASVEVSPSSQSYPLAAPNARAPHAIASYCTVVRREKGERAELAGLDRAGSAGWPGWLAGWRLGSVWLGLTLGLTVPVITWD
uniref:Uncharacterized protein n=1 Tax=Anopheles coluzzii TaxID=1518534 RepID=A0A8W7PBC8_ANOCL